ncbi:5'-methylthioadenosine/S-adenosylhomocysteine nucleosidase [Guptibacillus algicola]|uniref:5'-methylthioadenosine/S-adenosylhomocysteine nucleosidase n=1 Tax=Guptibacillus algicola TaxID=225844 RepID=UPI001CD739D6|nr:5'-methylthioadenosine/S-adenosylhomocysteine nucleosidase [Alkalihalobacillus algicola]MCA0986149.1 5'-methylthioadenosine/S-adenosylhomocysteine nucleosidase [Alkalihalobacillus algicola]
MKIGIIGAMEEEVRILRDRLDNRKEHTIAKSEFTTGEIDGQEVVLLKSGIGKVNAAIGTTLLNQLFEPDYIINTGSAGGFNPDLKVGDIVISNEVRYHDVDATIFGYEYGQVPQMPALYEPERMLVEAAERSAEKVTEHQVVKGLIATGDSFMNDAVRVDYVRSRLKNLDAAEMEAGAIAQVCYQFNTPFVVIRSLSDIAGKESNVSFEQFLETASINSANLVLNLVEELKNIG